MKSKTIFIVPCFLMVLCTTLYGQTTLIGTCLNKEVIILGSFQSGSLSPLTMEEGDWSGRVNDLIEPLELAKSSIWYRLTSDDSKANTVKFKSINIKENKDPGYRTYSKRIVLGPCENQSELYLNSPLEPLVEKEIKESVTESLIIRVKEQYDRVPEAIKEVDDFIIGKEVKGVGATKYRSVFIRTNAPYDHTGPMGYWGLFKENSKVRHVGQFNRMDNYSKAFESNWAYSPMTKIIFTVVPYYVQEDGGGEGNRALIVVIDESGKTAFSNNVIDLAVEP